MTLSAMQPQGGGLAGMLSLLYSTEGDYGWSAGMRAITHSLLDKVVVPDGPVLDVGCGGGAFVTEMARCSPQTNYCGLERNGQALQAADGPASSNVAFVQADMMNVPYADKTFSLCTALDSLDQNSVDMRAALRECRRVLVNDGVLLLRVSAYPWLYGPHDEAFGTGQRHSMDELLATLAVEQFAVERVTYANTLMAGPAILLRLLQRWKIAPFLPRLYTQHSLNRLLMWALKAEARWLRSGGLSMGLSLFVVCRKRQPANGMKA